MKGEITMAKRLFTGILAGILLLMLIAPAVSAAETSGTWGNHTWSYDNFTLTITGEGDMEPGQPWAAFKDTIEHVVFTGGVTKVADGAFEDYDAIETIDCGDSMREIGKRAFYDCNDITELRMPESFRIFGPESFRNCDLLSRIIFGARVSMIVGVSSSLCSMLFGMIIGLLVCYCFGTMWFMWIYNRTQGTISLMGTLSACVFPFILPDLIKMAVSILLINRLRPVIKQ